MAESLITTELLHSLVYERHAAIMVLPGLVHDFEPEFAEEVIAAHVRELNDMVPGTVVVAQRLGRAVYLSYTPGPRPLIERPA